MNSMPLINFSEIFPTKWSVLIFLFYMVLFVNQGLLVTGSQESTHVYNYNTVLVVLVIEMVKFVISVAAYCSRTSCVSFFEQIVKNKKLLWLYFIPAFLYCLSNNLAFVNLLNYDPATYFILLQLRVVITGILFQILFKRVLTAIQWMSLILLTIGCMIKNLNLNDSLSLTEHFHSSIGSNSTTYETELKSDGMHFNFTTCLIILQVLCSCFAGVYLEFLLKSDGLHVDVFIQNVFLYIDSVLCNVMVLCWQWNPNLFSKESFEEIVDIKVVLIILNNAAVGIVTSFFLKYLNSILKTVASALELVFVAILSWLLFGVPITLKTIISLSVVSFSIVLYSRNPVQNPAKSIQCQKSEAEEV